MMQQLIADIMPDVEVMHLVEESMIKQVMKAQGVTPDIAARIADYVHIAEKAGLRYLYYRLFLNWYCGGTICSL